MNSEKKDDSLGIIRIQLAEAIKARKCHKCGCFLQALDAIDRSESVGTALAPLIAEARTVALPKEYDCLGCAVCWPAIAINALAEVDSSAAEGLGSCPTDAPEERAGWPPLLGDYHVVRYHAPVAVCSLNSDALARRLATRAPEGLAMAGTLHTENLGIERIILNTIANPNIRFLILCGEDTRQAIGHLPGQSLESLFANGLDDRMRILGASGKRPFLKNVTPEQVDAFVRQIALVGRIGEQDEAVILKDIHATSARSPGPFEGAPVKLPVETIRAEEPPRLIPDPAGYFVIYPNARDRCLMLEHYTKAGVLTCVIQGRSSIAVYSTAVGRGLLTRLDHAAYLGRELARAEHAFRASEPYVQDRAPGALAGGAEPEGCGCPTGDAEESR